MPRLISRAATLAAAFGLATVALAQSVIRVESDGTGDFTMLQAAVDAANSGDTLLIGPGGYTGATIDAKSLHVVGSGAGVGTTFVVGIAVSNLGVSDQITARRLRLGSCLVSDCLGSVWIEGCGITASAPLYFERFVIEDSQAVVLRDCRRDKSASFTLPGIPANSGLSADRSTVWIYDSEFGGSHGGVIPVLMGTSGQGRPGGHGIHAIDSTLTIEGTTLTGGFGGIGYGPFGSDGPPGLGFVLSGSSVLTAHSSSWIGSHVSDTSTAMTLPPRVPTLNLPLVVREGDPLTFGLAGLNGRPTALTFAFTLEPIVPTFADGLLAFGTGYSAVPIGSPSGSLTIPTTVGNLLPTVQSAQFFIQAVQLATTGAGQLRVSPPRLTTIVDASF